MQRAAGSQHQHAHIRAAVGDEQDARIGRGQGVEFEIERDIQVVHAGKLFLQVGRADIRDIGGVGTFERGGAVERHAAADAVRARDGMGQTAVFKRPGIEGGGDDRAFEFGLPERTRAPSTL